MPIALYGRWEEMKGKTGWLSFRGEWKLNTACSLCRETYYHSAGGRNRRPQGSDRPDITQEHHIAFLMPRADHNPSSSQNYVTNPARIVP